jgi:hypothetical protein
MLKFCRGLQFGRKRGTDWRLRHPYSTFLFVALFSRNDLTVAFTVP